MLIKGERGEVNEISTTELGGNVPVSIQSESEPVS